MSEGLARRQQISGPDRSSRRVDFAAHATAQRHRNSRAAGAIVTKNQTWAELASARCHTGHASVVRRARWSQSSVLDDKHHTRLDLLNERELLRTIRSEQLDVAVGAIEMNAVLVVGVPDEDIA